MAIRAYATQNETITPEDYARMVSPLGLPFRVEHSGSMRPTVGDDFSVTVGKGIAFVGGCTVEITEPEVVETTNERRFTWLMLVVDWTEKGTAVSFVWSSNGYSRYEPGVNVSVPLVHFIDDGARRSWADLRVWGGMGGPLCCAESGFHSPEGIKAPIGTFLVEESTGGLSYRDHKAYQERVKVMTADGTWGLVSADASAADAERSALDARKAMEYARDAVGSTYWDGDKLTVNGVTSPSLRGPRGKQGEQGEQGKQGLKGDRGEKGDPGKDGTGFTLLGTVESPESLPVAKTAGEAWLVKSTNDVHVWSGSQWVNVGPIQGPKGDPGEPGEPGKPGEGVSVEVEESPYGYTFYKIGKLVILHVEYSVYGSRPEIMEIPYGFAPAEPVKFYVTYKTPEGVVGMSEIMQRDNMLGVVDGSSIPKGSFVSGTGMWMAK